MRGITSGSVRAAGVCSAPESIFDQLIDQLRGFTRRRKSLDDVPQPMQKIRRSSSAKGSGRASSAHKSAVREVMMVKRGSSEKSKDKALEKELPWQRIPEEEKHLYVEAEVKQWQEHGRATALFRGV